MPNKEMHEKVKEQANACKVITGKCLASYVNLNEPKSINGGKPKYSVSIVIPKSDTVTINNIKAAIKAAYDEGKNKLQGSGKSVPAFDTIKSPLRDGDKERPDDENYADSYFVNADSETPVRSVDRNRVEITERRELYSGMYARFSINFYTFNAGANRGIACGLNGVQKLSDGTPLGGKSRPEDDFNDGFIVDDDDDFLQ